MTKRKEPQWSPIWRFWLIERLVDLLLIVVGVWIAEHL